MGKTKEEIILNVEHIGSSGQKIVCLHGYGATRKCWYDIVPYLKEQYDLYLFDLIGCGESSAPRHWDYTIESQARIIHSYLIDNDFNDIILMGHSYGGGVALILNHLLKQSNHDIIKKNIFISPAAYHQTLPFFMKLATIPVINKIIMNTMPAEFLVREASKLVYYNKELITRSRIQRYIGNIDSPQKRRAFRRISENMVPKFTRNEIETMIDSITVDVLIIYGSDDKIIPRHNIERLHKAIEQSKLKIFEECGHAPHEEYPEKTVAEMKSFIGE